MDWIARAGWMAWPLGACALGALTLFIERWFSLRRSRILPEAWRREVLDGGSPAGPQPAAAALVSVSPRSRERLEAAGGRIAGQMQRGVSWLATIASVAPLLGLTGTVIGMIDVFQRITVAGGGGASVLAEGIWLALVTTVLGLLVAVPTLILHRLLEGRLSARLLELETFAEELLDRPEQP